MPYKALLCHHALGNAQHLRELTYLLEEQGQDWAGDMMELLTHLILLRHARQPRRADQSAAEGRIDAGGAREVLPRHDAPKAETQAHSLRLM